MSKPYGRVGAVMVLAGVVLAGCGGTVSGDPPGNAGTHPIAATVQAVERPVARPMDRGAEHPAEMLPVERPVARPPDHP